MEKYEISIHILDESYVDQLVTALVRQGHNVYYNADEKAVCFMATDEGVQKLEGNKDGQ